MGASSPFRYVVKASEYSSHKNDWSWKTGTYSEKSLKNGSIVTFVASSGLIQRKLKEDITEGIGPLHFLPLFMS